MAQSDSNKNLSNDAPNHFTVKKIDINVLAAEQGVPQSWSVQNLIDDFWPEDEDIDEVLATFRQWRQESLKETLERDSRLSQVFSDE